MGHGSYGSQEFPKMSDNNVWPGTEHVTAKATRDFLGCSLPKSIAAEGNRH